MIIGFGEITEAEIEANLDLDCCCYPCRMGRTLLMVMRSSKIVIFSEEEQDHLSYIQRHAGKSILADAYKHHSKVNPDDWGSWPSRHGLMALLMKRHDELEKEIAHGRSQKS